MAHTDIATALAAWREIERRLEDVDDGTPEAELLQAEAAELRELVQRLTSQPTGAPTEATA
jgi:hypothetical protein